MQIKYETFHFESVLCLRLLKREVKSGIKGYKAPSKRLVFNLRLLGIPLCNLFDAPLLGFHYGSYIKGYKLKIYTKDVPSVCRSPRIIF